MQCTPGAEEGSPSVWPLPRSPDPETDVLSECVIPSPSCGEPATLL